jgi:UDP-glucose 4-epimerase
MQGKTVAVTGGVGFIGSQVVSELAKMGAHVRVIDNAPSASRMLPKEVEVYKIDICNTDKVAEAFSGVSYVFHLAALPRVPLSIEKPQETHRTNVDGTLSVLEAARRAGVNRIIYSSSSSVYGDQGTLPLHEELPPQPKHPYGLQKYMGELLCRLWSEVYGVPTVCLRYFNVYGPGLDPKGEYALVIGKFLEQQQEGKPLTIVGDGTQTRDFTHVRDVARANIAAALSPNVGVGESINIGAGNNISINELAEIFGGPTEHLPPRVEAKHSRADIARAKQLLNWEPREQFSEGIAELKKMWNL